jgi:CRP-like cAMP-binding protein
LEKGCVKANKLSSDGQEFILRFFGPGDTFNDLAARAGHTMLKRETAGHQINMKEIRDE